MKAIGYTDSLDIENPLSLQDINIEQPRPEGRDLLIKVSAIAVNPVDSKIRKRAVNEDGSYKIIGWDAVGEVVSLGSEAKHFQVGDSVYYAGDLTRSGCNAEYQLVDERLVGQKPKALSDAEAAAIPLTAITAWELLFDHLQIKRLDLNQAQTLKSEKEVILVIGAAGGVGSILIQLIKSMTGATVVATASREASKGWVKTLGADYVIDHSQALGPQIDRLSLQVTHIASLTHTQDYWSQYTELLAPFGKISMIDDPEAIDVMALKPKSQSLHIEFMFARSMFQTHDMHAQGDLLNHVSALVDQGKVRTTLGAHLGQINASNLRKAHEMIESGQSIGKIVLEGFSN